MNSFNEFERFEEKSIELFYDEMICILNRCCESGKLWKISCFKTEATNLTIKYYGCHCYTKVCGECKKMLEKYKVEYFNLRMCLFEKRLYEFGKRLNTVKDIFDV